MIIGLIGLVTLSIWVNMAYYEYRVIKGPRQPKTLSFIGWRRK